MSVVLTILLIAFCIQGLVKFAVGFLVPYRTRVARIATYYERDGRIISIYDTVTLVIIVALVVLLFLIDMQELSFITGLVVGMLIIQIFFHRFDKPLAPEQSPESGAPPRKIMSYAIQAHPGLAWREIVLMTALLGWGLYALVAHLIG
jgi:heme/copper-type cytochrome/quinol oxidase subunit 2